MGEKEKWEEKKGRKIKTGNRRRRRRETEIEIESTELQNGE